MEVLRIIARALIFNDTFEKILLVRNRDGNFWYPPGGGREDGESLPSTISREVKEETGLHVIPVGPSYIQEFLAKNGKLYIELFWCCQPIVQNMNSTTVNDKEGSVGEMRWFDRHELNTFKVFPEILREGNWRDLYTRSLGLYLGFKQESKE